jgi:hypothetical protein
LTKLELKRLNQRLDRLLEEKLLAKVLRPIIFRGRRIQTAQDVGDVVRTGGIEYARQVQEEQEARGSVKN